MERTPRRAVAEAWLSYEAVCEPRPVNTLRQLNGNICVYSIGDGCPLSTIRGLIAGGPA